MESSIYENRVAIYINDSVTVQLVVWDLEKSSHKFLETQINLITSISSKIDEWVKHLRINGFDAELEDIYDATV